MTVRVSISLLIDAVEYVSASESGHGEGAAYLDRTSGAIHWVGECIDEPPPDDLDDADRYLAVPGRRCFDLGRTLVMRFASERMPDAYDAVGQCFRSKGAYSRYKALLERKGKLDEWRAYEQQALEDALQEWAEDNGLVLEWTPAA